MLPTDHFVEKVLGNARPWLRIYEKEKEVTRLEEFREQKCKEITVDAVQASNREWPHVLRNYLKQHDKHSYASIGKLVKYGIDPNERCYCFAELLPP